MLIKNSLIALSSAFLLSACQQNGQPVDGADAEGAGEIERPTVVRGSAGQASPSTGMTYEEQIASAKADFAERFDKSEGEFEIREAVLVDWPSGALGCPQKGMNYTMALVPGLRILIRSGQAEFHYHATRGGEPFYCPADRVEKPASTPSEAIM